MRNSLRLERYLIQGCHPGMPDRPGRGAAAVARDYARMSAAPTVTRGALHNLAMERVCERVRGSPTTTRCSPRIGFGLRYPASVSVRKSAGDDGEVFAARHSDADLLIGAFENTDDLSA